MQKVSYKNKLLMILVAVLSAVAGLLVAPTAVGANGITVPDPGIGLQPINIPTFLSLDQIQNFSLLSYFSLIFALVFLGVGMLWVILVIRGALEYLRSEGDEGMIESGMKKIRNVLVSISMLFVFLVAIVFVASFFGIGNFWEWPRSFSLCNGNLSKDPGAYYFRYYLQRASEGASTDQIDRECFN